MQLTPGRRILRQLGKPGQSLLFGAHAGKAITDNFDCNCGLIYGQGTHPKLRRTGLSDEDHPSVRKLANTAEKSF
jgi:hypothetical protein